MNLSHINDIKRSDLDKHIYLKKLLLLKKIPNNDIVNYILYLIIKQDSYWVSLGYEITNIKYLWIEYYFNIILENYGNSEYITILFNKIIIDYIDIKSTLDNIVCDIYNNDNLPEYPDIKISKIFYNLLNIDKTYTSKIKGIYPKNLNLEEKDNLLLFIDLNNKYIKKILTYFDSTHITYINKLKKHLIIFENILNNI